MKNYKIIFSTFFLFSVVFAQAQQEPTTLTIAYNAAMPMNGFKNAVSSTSFRGFQATVLHKLSDKISVGLGTGFQDFYQKNPRQLYKFSDGSDVSAVTTYSIQTIPLLAEVKYNFTPDAAVQPYAALGAGGNFISYNHLYGEFGNPITKFGFAARPEAGVYIPFKNGSTGITVGASYNIMPFKQDGLTNLNSASVHAGITIPLRR